MRFFRGEEFVVDRRMPLRCSVLRLGIALLVNNVTWGQRTLRTIMMLPMMFSPNGQRDAAAAWAMIAKAS